MSSPEPDPLLDRLSVDQVRHVAKLARLALEPAELDDAQVKLSAILGYVRVLGELDLAAVDPLYHPLESTNRPAGDEPGPTLTPDALLAIAPAHDGPFVAVPKVIGEGGKGGVDRGAGA